MNNEYYKMVTESGVHFYKLDNLSDDSKVLHVFYDPISDCFLVNNVWYDNFLYVLNEYSNQLQATDKESFTNFLLDALISFNFENLVI